MASRPRRKPKQSRRQTVSRRRHADLLRQRRKRYARRRTLIAEVKRRRRMVRRYHTHQHSGLFEQEAAALTARHYGCSVSTVRRYASAYEKGGLPALKPKAPGPSHAQARIPLSCRMLIVTIRTLVGWCGQRICAELDRRQICTLSHTSVYRILRRYHMKMRTYHPKAIRNGIDYTRYERKCANDLWHVDFKGPIKPGSHILYLFVIQDDYSRYVPDVHVCFDCTADTAIASVQRAFQRYGAPGQLMSDNGKAFTSVRQEVDHRFDQALRPYGVEHLLIAPCHPEENGKVEAFIKILSHEALTLLVDQVKTPRALQEAIDVYVTYYNNYRAHSALDYHPPVTRYPGITPTVRGLAMIRGLPDLGCPEWTGWAEPPPTPVKALVLST